MDCGGFADDLGVEPESWASWPGGHTVSVEVEVSGDVRPSLAIGGVGNVLCMLSLKISN